MAVPEEIATFLGVETPNSWIDAAVERLPELLNDHANCELKAASSALALIYRYPERTDLCARMSRLAREELRHFEQVRRLMDQEGVPFRKLTASRYAGALREYQRENEPLRLLDSLLIGALIEARSCERFAVLAPRLRGPIRDFYKGLLASEARHFQNYLALARSMRAVDEQELAHRLHEFVDAEADLIRSADAEFRFHSGAPPETQGRRAAHTASDAV